MPSAMHPFAAELAKKLVTEQVLFFTGAGLSFNWDHRLGGQIATAMHDDFGQLLADNAESLGLPAATSTDAERQALQAALEQIKKWDLPLVSELLGQNKCWYIRRYIVPDLTGSDRPAYFKSLAELTSQSELYLKVGIPHIVLGRLAKEGLIKEVMTVNVDALHEAGFELVGLERVERLKDDALRFPWVEAYQVLSDRKSYAEPLPLRKVVTLHKIHGCIERTRAAVLKQNRADPGHACTWSTRLPSCKHLEQAVHNFVFTYRELLNWRSDTWAKDLVSDRIRNHHLLFVGFAVADAVLHATLRDIYNELEEEPVEPEGQSRVRLLGAANPRSSRLRAQVIGVEPNIQSLSVLLAANGGDPIRDEAQFYLIQEPKRSRDELDRLFRHAYTLAIVEQLKDHLMLRAHGMLAAWQPKSPFGQIKKQVDDLAAFLDQQADLPGDGSHVTFLYDALPASVRLSWLVNDSLLAAGVPQGESRRVTYWERLIQPHYYVPLTGAFTITVRLLRAYQVLLQEYRGAVDEHGWVHLPATRNRPAVHLLPIMARRNSNVAMLRRLGIQPPSTAGVAGLLELADGVSGGSHDPVTYEELLADPSRVPVSSYLPTIALSHEQLWGDGIFTAINAALATLHG